MQRFLKTTSLIALVLAAYLFVSKQQTATSSRVTVKDSQHTPTARPSATHTVDKQFMTYAETRMIILNDSKINRQLTADQVSCVFRYFEEGELMNSNRAYKSETVSLKHKNLTTEKSLTLVFASAGKCVEEINCDIRLAKNSSDNISFEKKLIERIPKQGCIAEAQVKWTASQDREADTAMPTEIENDETAIQERQSVKQTKTWIEKALTTDFVKTLQEAKMTPYLEEGSLKGYVVHNVKAGSIYDRMGLQDGDIVTHVNDAEVTNGSLRLFEKNEDTTTKITIQRNGEMIDLIY